MANRNIEFVRSKACRDCSQRIFYNMAKHEWADDDGSQGFNRHKCSQWQPKQTEVIDALSHISRVQIDHSTQLSQIKKYLWEISQDLQKLRAERTHFGDHE